MEGVLSTLKTRLIALSNFEITCLKCWLVLLDTLFVTISNFFIAKYILQINFDMFDDHRWILELSVFLRFLLLYIKTSHFDVWTEFSSRREVLINVFISFIFFRLAGYLEYVSLSIGKLDMKKYKGKLNAANISEFLVYFHFAMSLVMPHFSKLMNDHLCSKKKEEIMPPKKKKE